METEEISKKATMLLKEWDPFLVGPEAYKVEIVEVVANLQVMNHPTEVAQLIREVYEQSYNLWIPIEECMQIAYKLIAVKFEAKSIIT